MNDRTGPDPIERMARSVFLLPPGYRRFPPNPRPGDWRALILGNCLFPLMLTAGALWLKANGSPGAGITIGVAAVFTAVWVLPKVVLWWRTRGSVPAGEQR